MFSKYPNENDTKLRRACRSCLPNFYRPPREAVYPTSAGRQLGTADKRAVCLKKAFFSVLILFVGYYGSLTYNIV